MSSDILVLLKDIFCFEYYISSEYLKFTFSLKAENIIILRDFFR